MRVLYVNYDFPPMSGPGVWRALWFIRYLAPEGFQFTVLCGDRSHWCDRYDESLLSQIPEGVEVVRLRARFPDEMLQGADRLLGSRWLRIVQPLYRPLRWRFRAYYPEQDFWWLLKACWRGVALARSRHIDCVVTSGPPHVTHLVGLVLKRTCRTKWIMDYRDLWTDDPMQFPRGGYQSRMFARLERDCVRRADAVLTVSPSWMKLLASRHERRQSAPGFCLIRNGHNVDSPPTSGVLAAPAEPKRLTIHYNGTPQYLSETPNFIEAVSRLLSSEESTAPAPLITFSGMSGALRRSIQETNLQEVVVDVGMLRYQEGIERSQRSQVLMVLVNNDHPVRRGTIPAKTYEAMALNKHVLAVVPLQSDVRDLLLEYGNATLCDVDDPDDICRGLRSLTSLHRAGALDGRGDCDLPNPFGMRFSRRELARQMGQLLNSVVNGEDIGSTSEAPPAASTVGGAL